MTPKDIRDIAAYYGSPCSDANHFYSVVDATTLEGLEIDATSGFMLRLRPLASLTDEELTHCGTILFEFESGELDHFMTDIRRTQLIFKWIDDEGYTQKNKGSLLELGDVLSIDPDGRISVWGKYSSSALAKIYAYLQSIGIYIPGTIRPELVELQP